MPSKIDPRASSTSILTLARSLAVAAGLGLAGSVSLAEAPDTAAANAFLDLLPKIEVPDDVEPIPGAVNEEFRNCRAAWPVEYAISQKGPEARAYRDIYGFVKARNVMAKQDCTCDGKVAVWSDVEALADQIRASRGVKKLGWRDTQAVFAAYNELLPVAETMCGGKF